MDRALISEIEAEQDRGRAKYGKGATDFAHDDSHSAADWFLFIRQHNVLASSAVPEDYRRRCLVKVAGLAISAIEAIDRKWKREK